MLPFDELKRRKIVQWALAYLAGAWLVVEVADHFAEEPDRGYSDLVTAAVADDPEDVARALADYVDEGGRDARSIGRDPVFDRVRDHPIFEAELERLGATLARQRRQVERQLADAGSNVGSRE